MSVYDYSTTPSVNTAINTINIAEGCAPANINNAIRQLMADVKAYVSTADSDYFPEAYGTIGGALDTVAIQAAIDAAGAAGGGRVVLSGQYTVYDQSSTPTTWDDRVCIHVLVDNVQIVGLPGSKITLADSQDAHVIKFGARSGSDVGLTSVSDCSITGVEIDGNRANQTTATQSDYHGAGVDVSDGCTRITIQNNVIHDTQYYAIGVQRANAFDILIDSNRLYNCGADGIDCKSDDGDSYGNVISNNTISAYGLVGGLTFDQTGIDARQGWTVRDNHVTIPGTNKGLVGIRSLEHTTGAGALTSSQGVVIKDNTITAASATGTIGIYIDALKIKGGGNEISGCGLGFDIRQRECEFVGDDVIGGTDGVNVGDSAYQTDGDNVALIGLTVRGCSGDGVTADDAVQGVVLVAPRIRGNDRGLVIAAGANHVAVHGGSIASNTTADLVDSGSNTILRDVYGIATENTAQTTFAIDSTGRKTFTIGHGLDVTPDITDVVLSIQRNTAVTDATISAPVVTGVTSTNVTGEVWVTAASATGSATAYVNATVTAKRG